MRLYIHVTFYYVGIVLRFATRRDPMIIRSCFMLCCASDCMLIDGIAHIVWWHAVDAVENKALNWKTRAISIDTCLWRVAWSHLLRVCTRSLDHHSESRNEAHALSLKFTAIMSGVRTVQACSLPHDTRTRPSSIASWKRRFDQMTHTLFVKPKENEQNPLPTPSKRHTRYYVLDIRWVNEHAASTLSPFTRSSPTDVPWRTHHKNPTSQ
jgi:hypothetical protein